MSAAEEYARWALLPENSRRTGRLVKLAAQRFLNDLTRKDIHFDEEKAVECVVYCERYLCLWEDKWRGQPMDFRPWMRFIFDQIFGWVRVATGLRRFRKVLAMMAKKNAKSTLAGGLIDFHLTADKNVSTPSIFIGANGHEQAQICLKIAGKILENSPEMANWLDDGDIQLLYNYGEINKIVLHPNPEREDGREGSVVALSKEGSDKKSKTSGGKHGKNPSLVIIDEFGMAADDNLLNDMESGQAARDEPLLFVITTAGFNTDGPCFTKLRRTGIQVLEGTMTDDDYLVVIHEVDAPIGEDGKPKEITIDYLIENEDVWEQCNPNIDISVRRDFLRSRLQSAKNEGGTKDVEVKTLNFNLWVDSPEVFIPAHVWNKNIHGLSEEDLNGQLCYGGIEIVSGRLLNAFCFLFPNVRGYQVIKPIFWMPAQFPDKPENFAEWGKEKLIHELPGNVVDNDKVHELIMEHIEKYDMHSFAFKNTLETNDIVQSLIKNSIRGDSISHGYQGISTPTLAWEEILTKGNAEHFGNPVMAWMNGNCLCKRKENDVRLEKSGSKIVGIYAGINALAQWKTIESGPRDDDKSISGW